MKTIGLIASHAESIFLGCQRAIVVSVASIALLVSGLASANELTGTWSGVLTQGNDRFEVEWTFSEAGYFNLVYTNNKGKTRSVELTTPGQKIEYVPPGGGVKTHVVGPVLQEPGRLSFGIRTTFDRASGGYLDQRYLTELYQFLLDPDGLTTVLRTQSSNHFGDKELSTGGADENVAEGVLHKTTGTYQDDERTQFEKAKQEIQDMTRQQQRMSEELNELDEKAKEAINRIRSGRDR